MSNWYRLHRGRRKSAQNSSYLETTYPYFTKNFRSKFNGLISLLYYNKHRKFKDYFCHKVNQAYSILLITDINTNRSIENKNTNLHKMRYMIQYHKLYTGRSIVSAIGILTQHISGDIDHILNILLPTIMSYKIYDTHFLQILHKLIDYKTIHSLWPCMWRVIHYPTGVYTTSQEMFTHQILSGTTYKTSSMRKYSWNAWKEIRWGDTPSRACAATDTLTISSLVTLWKQSASLTTIHQQFLQHHQTHNGIYYHFSPVSRSNYMLNNSHTSTTLYSETTGSHYNLNLYSWNPATYKTINNL